MVQGEGEGWGELVSSDMDDEAGAARPGRGCDGE